MFTIETDMDETLITIMDDTGELEDASVLLYDDYVHMRQWNEKNYKFDVITMTPEMWEELILAIDSPEGSYIVQRNGRVVE